MATPAHFLAKLPTSLSRLVGLLSEPDSPEDAAFGGPYDLEHFPTTSDNQPWLAFWLYLFFQFSFLAYWVYLYGIYRQRRTVVRAREAVDAVQPVRELDDLRGNLHVMCGSLEHSLSHLEKGKATSGGLGKVVHILGRTHPTTITFVHPMCKQGEKLNYENSEVEWDTLRISVDGRKENVKVYYQRGADATGLDGEPVTVHFLLLSHDWFEVRDPSSDIYPEPMSRLETLRFYSLWNQCYAELIIRVEPHVIHMPDFHSCVAPWYVVKKLPNIKMVLICHNAEYQGDITTDMLHDKEKVERLAAIWNLPPSILKKHMVHEGRFNMLKAGVDFVMQKQGGKGIHAVSTHYAKEINSRYGMLWKLKIKGLDNPMLPEERPALGGLALMERKKSAKAQVQQLLGLTPDPNARLFVSLGRLVRMKGVDIIADVAPWLLDNYPNAQLAVIGPVADGYGVYCREKLYAMKDNPKYQGRLFVKCEWMNVPPEMKFGADFCIMPSRDEPFGYVDIEFAWHGAVMVGAEAGGLGKVPGFYYIAQNRENSERLQGELKKVMDQAMTIPADKLEIMATEAIKTEFPLAPWQQKLMMAYKEVLPHDIPIEHSGSGISLPGQVGSAVPDMTPAGDNGGVTFQPFLKQTEDIRPRSLKQAFVQVTEWMEGQPPAPRDSWMEGTDEFLVQELSTNELAKRVKAKLSEEPNMIMGEVIESIGFDVNMQREKEGSMEQKMLGTTCGLMRVHLCVLCGYLVAPVVDFFTIVICSEWLLRVPFVINLGKTQPGLKFDNIPSVFLLFFMIQSLGFVVGAPTWTMLTKWCQPRRILGANMVLQFVFIPIMAVVTYNIQCTMVSAYQGHTNGCKEVSTGGFLTAGVIIFCKSVVSSGSLLFLCFSFMMSLKTDLSFAALRMGGIEMARYAVTYLPVLYVLLVSPTSFVGSESHPVPPSFFWALLPIIFIIGFATLVPGVLLFFFAPGSYRDDRFPGWEITLVLKRKSFLLLALSDCVGALALFPNITYIWWWFAATYNHPESLEIFIVIFTLVFVAGFLLWAWSLSEASKSGVRFLAGAAILIAPPGIIRAVAQEESSTYITSGAVPIFALVLSGLSVLLEGIRTTAQWTAKIKVLDSRWRLLSYGTLNVAALSFFALLSPALTMIAIYAGFNKVLWIGAVQVKELADWAMLTVVPVSLAQFCIQVCASLFIYRDMGANVVPVKSRFENKCLRAFTAPVLLVISIVLISFLSLQPAFKELHSEVPYRPTRRCDVKWTEDYLKQVRDKCKGVEKVTGPAFNRNRNGQITIARYNCIQHMTQKGADTFFLHKHDDSKDNTCEIMTCGKDPLSIAEPDSFDPFEPKDTWPIEVWSRHRAGAGNPEHKLVGTQLMEWNWKDIAYECKYLGEAGIDYIHVSPPADHIAGNLAYIKYQPTSWALDSRSGTTEEFRDMVRICRENNVAIMVDFIINHLASSFPTPEIEEETPYKTDDHGTKQCGVNIDCASYTGKYYGSRYFDCKEWDSKSGDCDIKASTFHHTIGDDSKPACTFSMDPGAVQINPFVGFDMCDAGFGSDLNTEDLHTVRLLQDYLLRLLDAGVTMLRTDAATLVAASSTGAILEPFPWEFTTMEVIGWSKSTTKMFDMNTRFKISTMYDFSYGIGIGPAIYNKDTFANLPTYRPTGPTNLDVLTAGWESEMIPRSENVLVYVDNHDGMSAFFNYHRGQPYGQGTLFMLAHPFGAAAQVMSSFWYEDAADILKPDSATQQTPPLVPLTPEELERSRTDYRVNLTRKVKGAAGRCRISPIGAWGNASDTDQDWKKGKCLESDEYGCEWVCQHRWTGVAGLTHVRKSIPKNIGMSRIWSNSATGTFCFSLGDIAWVFMQFYLNPRANLTDLLPSPPQVTGLQEGAYCNLAQLPSNYSGSLSQWAGSLGQKYCSDPKNDMLIRVDVNGFVSEGVAPLGTLNGMVVIHKDFQAQSTSPSAIHEESQAQSTELFA